MNNLQAVYSLFGPVDEVLHPVDGDAVQTREVLSAFHREEEVDFVLTLVLGSDGRDVHLLHLVLGDLFSGHGWFRRVC